ncbi:MAG: hypothetical protein UZ11_BCD004000128 [Bacteroidetes bacterium OLB11]|nr:MAG: hypothetical protein UZ11_BCD004000128 [Bacteroidetes bacterium OLB11]
MRRKLLILSLITALFAASSVNVFAAPKDDPASKLPFKKKLKWADALYKQASFYTAVDYYMQLKKEQPPQPIRYVYACRVFLDDERLSTSS